MQSVGKILREARIGANLSLEQVSAQTRISLRNLQAIENDDPSAAPSPFFYKSFVSQFAKQVGVAPEALTPLMTGAAATMPEPLLPGQGELAAAKPHLKPLRPRRNARWAYPVASLVLMLVGCSSFYAFWQSTRKSDLFHAVTGWLPGSSIENLGEARTAAKAESPEPANRPAVSEPQHGFRVEFSALEPTWLSATADGRQSFRGILEPEQKKVLEGHDKGRIRTGNAGGISIVYNGRPIGVIGPRGQVRTVVFTDTDYQVLRPELGVALLRFNPIDEWAAIRPSLP